MDNKRKNDKRKPHGSWHCNSSVEEYHSTPKILIKTEEHFRVDAKKMGIISGSVSLFSGLIWGSFRGLYASDDTSRVLNWLSLTPRRTMQKCILSFKCLNNLVPKYVTQYFTRNVDLHDHASRRSNDLHPPKPKRNIGKRTFKYTWDYLF